MAAIDPGRTPDTRRVAVCVVGRPDCPGPDADADELPCWHCLARGGDA